MSGQQPPPPRGWGRMPPSPSPSPFRPGSPLYAPSPPPIMGARRLPGSPMTPMTPMSPMFGCPSPARLPPRVPGSPGPGYIPCPRPRWPSPLPPGVPMPPGPRPYGRLIAHSPSPPMMCPSPEYWYAPYEVEYVGIPLEPPGPLGAMDMSGQSTADIIASQSQDYVDEKLAEYQATIHQLQVALSADVSRTSYEVTSDESNNSFTRAENENNKTVNI